MPGAPVKQFASRRPELVGDAGGEGDARPRASSPSRSTHPQVTPAPRSQTRGVDEALKWAPR